MKSTLLHILLLFISSFSFAQTETFENETANATSFSVGGLNFTTTGDLFVEFFAGLGCSSDFWLGSGFGNGGSSGSFGAFQVSTAGTSFTLSTSTAFCAWTSDTDGNSFANGSVQFTGTLAAGGSITETIAINPPDNVTFDMITLSNAIWGGQTLTALEMTIISGGINYIAIDNLPFASVNLLPVELSSFKGENLHNEVHLSWETFSETNNRGFEIEHSIDGINWSVIGFLEGQGNSAGANSYTYLHKPLQADVNYYRLKQIDFNGSYKLSEIIAVQTKEPLKNVLVYPNPTPKNFTIQVASPNKARIGLVIRNQLGQEVYRTSSIPHDDLWEKIIDIQESGMYTLTVQVGAQLRTQKIIVL